jgi:hypothetical protein
MGETDQAGVGQAIAITFGVIVPVIVGAALLLVYMWRAKRIAGWLVRRKQWFQSWQWIVSVFLGLVIAFLVDVADISDVVAGNAEWGDILLAMLAGTATAVYFFGLFVAWKTEREQQTELEQAEKDRLAAEVERNTIKASFDSYRELSLLIRQLLAARWSRICRATGDSIRNRKPVHPRELKEILAPEEHFMTVIAALHQCVRQHYRGKLEDAFQLRLAYLEPEDDRLVVKASHNGCTRDCIQTPNNKFSEKFTLGPTAVPDCLAVYCSLHGYREPIIVSHADMADQDESLPYRHFSGDQRRKIKSIVAFPCQRADSDSAPHPVITLDTDKPGFFSEAKADVLNLKRVLERMSMQLLYERDLQKLALRCQEEELEGVAHVAESGN